MSETCLNCGAPLRAGYRFCSNCGATLSSSMEAPSESAKMTTLPPDVVSEASTPEVVLPTPTRFEPYAPQSPTTGYIPSPPSGFQPPQPPPAREEVARRDRQAMYVPYAAEAAPAATSPRRSLLPAIIIGAVLLLGLLALSAYLLLRGNPSAANVVTSDCRLPANPSEEDRVRQVVCLSNNEQIQAWRNLDTEVLKGTRTGQVLQENITYVEDLKQKNMYAVPKLNSIQILEAKVSGDTATVTTIESWSVKFYNRDTNKEVDSQNPETLAETYHMVKQNGKWLVEKLDFGQKS